MHRPDYLPAHLTGQQVEAILHRDSPLLILAGPGSGKTEVITWRVAHLLRAGYTRPEHLLVTTFTQKAALEPKDPCPVTWMRHREVPFCVRERPR
jgi:DNA helicase-2/ATP-dependent DNA helicase PcrA